PEPVAVELQEISKTYPLYRRPIDRLIEVLPGFTPSHHTDFHALRSVSLSIKKGEVAAFIGPNGSGKSTLLQIVSGVMQPTTGRVRTEGRIASLLELGAGFNPELTGIENVWINAGILGLSRKEIAAALPHIEAFAGIGEFITRPVKEYSSGMYVRLAFSTAIHVDPEILIVDEALAVGDAVFSNRCIRKFEEFRARGVTILFVSHDLGLVKQLADRAWFLHHGEVVATGDPGDVVNRYIGMVLAPEVSGQANLEPTVPSMTELPHSFRHGDGRSVIEQVELVDGTGASTRLVLSGDRVCLRVTVRFRAAVTEPMIGMLIRNRNAIDVFGINTRVAGVKLPAVASGDSIECEFAFSCRLPRNEYTVTVASQNTDGTSQDWRDDVLSFAVSNPRDIAGLVDIETDISCRLLPEPVAAREISENRVEG
ncbi:MAG: ABC transporter ATP-binding protein, partial [Bryobacterales bacterium]|nr:ABC transporter ATP-binding protein [Bryobacterales bacterium]